MSRNKALIIIIKWRGWYWDSAYAAGKTITDANEEEIVQSSPLPSAMQSLSHQKSTKSNPIIPNQQKLDPLWSLLKDLLIDLSNGPNGYIHQSDRITLLI